MKKVTPVIAESSFRNEILRLQGIEGNRSNVLKYTNTFSERVEKEDFFQEFIEVCSHYNIHYDCFEQNNPLNRFKVVITINGYDYYYMDYNNIKQDIGAELARVLCKALAVAVTNEQYLRDL